MSTHAAVVHYALEPLAVELREIPVPEVGDTDVLLAVGAVSVCGSDVHQAHNTHSWNVNVPVVLGHEFGGTVAKTGRAVRGFREGDRVVSETAAQICGECMQCRTGWYNLCPSRLGFGYGLDGAMAQYVRVPARCLHRIPDSLPFDLACLNLLYAPPADPARVAAELYRVLKPGGKAFVLAPARYDAGFWQDVLLPLRRWYRPPADLTAAPRHSARSLRRLFGQFTEHGRPPSPIAHRVRHRRRIRGALRAPGSRSWADRKRASDASWRSRRRT